MFTKIRLKFEIFVVHGLESFIREKNNFYIYIILVYIAVGTSWQDTLNINKYINGMKSMSSYLEVLTWPKNVIEEEKKTQRTHCAICCTKKSDCPVLVWNGLRDSDILKRGARDLGFTFQCTILGFRNNIYRCTESIIEYYTDCSVNNSNMYYILIRIRQLLIYLWRSRKYVLIEPIVVERQFLDVSISKDVRNNNNY